jgi:ABC-2 type transport system ATP-binding protein
MEAIVAEGLTKAYKALGRATTRSLDGLDLVVGQNEVFGFLGRNGAGKTTTIKLLCSLLRATSGTARIFGDDIRTRQARSHIGYLPEQPYFYEYLTPRETLDFYGRLRGQSAGERAREWDRLSELLDLRDIAAQRLKGFSKGMRQRVGFAVALVGNPKLLILDEPMSGLDPIGRHSIRELILRCRDEHKTIFFSSHVLGDVEVVCDRVGILIKGRLTQQGRVSDLLSSQVHQVEIVAGDLPAPLVETLRAGAEKYRLFEGRHFFTVPGAEPANDAVRQIHQAGGKLLEFTPLKARLEDYFIQEQARHGGVERGAVT